jgi:hypothetical protein
MRPDHGFSSYQQLLISPVYIGFIITTLSSLPSHFLRLNLFYQVSDKGLLERCGTGKGYLIEIPPIQSDLRVCASGEPKSEQNGPGPRMFRKSMKPETFFQRLSHRASEIKGLRLRSELKMKQKPFGVIEEYA